MKKILQAFVFVLFLFCFCHQVNAASDFTLKTLDYNVALKADGSMDVIQTWNVNIHGETNTLFWEFEKDQSNFTNVKVKETTGRSGKELLRNKGVDVSCYNR